MSGGPRIRSINVADPEHRPVLGPAGNKGRSVELQKRVTKPQKKLEKAPVTQAKEKKASLSPVDAPPAKSTLVSSPSTLKQQDPPLRSYVPLNASCSSDGSSDSSYSRVSTGRIARRCTTPRRRKQCAVKTEKAEKVVDGLVSASSPDNLHDKKTCTWITANTGVLFFFYFIIFFFLLSLLLLLLQIIHFFFFGFGVINFMWACPMLVFTMEFSFLWIDTDGL